MIWVILVMMSAIFGAGFLIIQKMSLSKEHAMEFATVISLMTAIFSVIFVPYVELNFSIIIWLMLTASSIMLALAFLYMAKSLRHSQISNTLPLLTFTPVITLLLATLFIGEVVTLNQFLGICLLIFGSYFLRLKKISHVLVPFKLLYRSKSDHYILVSVLFYGAAGVIDKYVLNFVNPWTVVVVTSIFRAILFLILISIFHNGFKGVKNGFVNFKWVIIASLAVILVGIFLVFATSIAPVSLVSALSRLSIMLAVFMGGKLFHEGHIAHKIAASAIMLAGAYLVVT